MDWEMTSLQKASEIIHSEYPTRKDMVKLSRIEFDEEDKKWHVYYHNITEENDCYADERIALEHLFDHVRAWENWQDDYFLPF